jgi:hypothetical protein
MGLNTATNSGNFGAYGANAQAQGYNTIGNSLGGFAQQAGYYNTPAGQASLGYNTGATPAADNSLVGFSQSQSVTPAGGFTYPSLGQ